MSTDPEKTDPGFSAKAHEAALRANNAAREANKKADPWADRALYAIQGSEYSAVIIVCVVIALIGLGLWIARG